MPRKFTDEQELEAVNLYQQGLATTYDLATRYTVSRTAIKYLLRRHNVRIWRPADRKRKPPSTQEETERLVVAYRLAGVRFSDIARRVGVGGVTVSEILIKHGLHTRLKRGENSTARRKIKPEQEPEIVRLYQEGVTIEALASKYACTQKPMREALLRRGVELRKRGGAIKALALRPGFTERVLELWEVGETQTAIAKELECDQTSISRLLRFHGIQARSVGERHGRWRGGISTSKDGYVRQLIEADHRFASMRTANGYVFQHRLVMAEYLERPLFEWETVHHIDGDRAHNEIENLQLRIGKHGAHVRYKCLDCGSYRLTPTEL